MSSTAPNLVRPRPTASRPRTASARRHAPRPEASRPAAARLDTVRPAPAPRDVVTPDGPRCREPAARGFTLLELSVVLTLVTVLVGLGAPLWRSAADRWVVRAVRDQAAVAMHRTRLEARRWGGARLEFDAEEGRVRLYRVVPDSLVWEDAALADHGVELVLPRGATGTTLVFDALGLGIVASRTLVFRRGSADARLIVSSRGRGTRR